MVGNAVGRLLSAGIRNTRRPRMVAEITLELVQGGEAVQVQRLRGYWHTTKGGELVTTIMSADEIKRYLASIGSKGGKTTGASKRRGEAAYYKRISKKAAQARKRKAANDQAQRAPD